MADDHELQLISSRLERGEIDSAQYLDELTRFVTRFIGCSRAGVRLFVDVPGGRILRCAAMFDATLNRMVSAPDLTETHIGPYLEQLLRDGSVLSTNARADHLITGALLDYVLAANVKSLMDMSLSVNGMLLGTFSCEQIGHSTQWSQRQLQALRKIAFRSSLTLMHLVSFSSDTAPGALWEISTPSRLATLPMPLQGPER